VENVSPAPLALPGPRPRDGHKGTFGKVLVIAGSRGMSGAAVLSGRGALRGGAGLVYLAVPSSIQAIVSSGEPSYLVQALPETRDGRVDESAAASIREAMQGMDAVAIGPGLGQTDFLTEFVATLLREAETPLVLDADALNAIAATGLGDGIVSPVGPRVITPHPGEMARLVGISIPDVQQDRLSIAADLARRWKTVVLLKGAGTVVTDGDRFSINPTGNPGMATGGSGDVLTGLIAALLGQGMTAFDAARLGAWLHGTAGDLAAVELSEPGLIASDLPRFLGPAWKRLLPSN
jgi:ADP-dependent NAD(P)H-hydrate dehydratase